MAEFDAYEWGQKVDDLPAGQGIITNNGDGTFELAVLWDEAGGAAGTGCDPANPADKTCVLITLRP